MTPRAWLLIAWVLVGAAVLVVHAVVLWQCLTARSLPWRARIVALAPPLAPVVAWVAGRRVAPISWVVLVVAYVTLRMLG